MKLTLKLLLGLFAVVAIGTGQSTPKSYTGVITDSMCGGNHNMGISPDEKCVHECVRMDPKKWKYALLVGKDVFILSDQKTPEQFAAKKVKITGTLFQKTKILKADKIELVR